VALSNTRYRRLVALVLSAVAFLFEASLALGLLLIRQRALGS
jgi:hypothetical protein